jgi:cardiolipin synthase
MFNGVGDLFARVAARPDIQPIGERGSGIGSFLITTMLSGMIILLREITVSGLREFLAEVRVGVPVSRLAKWKTTIQMLALGFLIVGDAGPAFLPG